MQQILSFFEQKYLRVKSEKLKLNLCKFVSTKAYEKLRNFYIRNSELIAACTSDIYSKRLEKSMVDSLKYIAK